MASILTVDLKLRLGQIPIDKFMKLPEDEAVYHELDLASGTTDFAVDFGGVGTADILYVESDKQISYRVAVAGTSITVDAEGFSLIWGSAPTTLLLSNASGSTAAVKILIAGT